MPNKKSNTGSELFIVDNSNDDWKVLRYLRDWCQLSKQIDIATGYFEIGALLSLDGEWQKVGKIRLLMGNEVSLRTKAAFADGLSLLKKRLDDSIEHEKEKNDFLKGVDGIFAAISSGQIECRVYRKEKFHAKAYITYAKIEVVGATALIGSSNFTYPGLTENIELNVQITGRPVSVLQEWYEEHWNDAEDVSEELLKTIERHVREYTPFEVYAKSLQEYFRGHELSATDWELVDPAMGGSKVYKILDKYQQEGYHALLKIAKKYGGAFLCDGVGLGKTYIGLMLIERLLYERKKIVLFVPKATNVPVWQNKIDKYLPNIYGDYSNLAVFNHTDLLRGGEFQRRLERIRDQADVVIIDEAHHFRNPGTMGKSRYWRLLDIIKDKQLFMLTATPVNNSLRDLQHLMELFTQQQTDYFKGAPLGIHSLSGHFRRMEKHLDDILAGNHKDQQEIIFEVNQDEATKVLFGDHLFRELVVQRSRAYVKESLKKHGGSTVVFTERKPPQVANYSIRKTYGDLVDMIEKAFNKAKPLFSLAMYYPMGYPASKDVVFPDFDANRQKQVVVLVRTQFLKRFESSARAFEMSCETLLVKMLTWLEKNCVEESEVKRLGKWKGRNEEILTYVRNNQKEYEQVEDQDEDFITPEMLEDIELLDRKLYAVQDIINETLDDLEEIVKFLDKMKDFKSENDDKLKSLIALLKKDPELKGQKVLIFTEYMATARYLKKELVKAGIDGVDEVDSGSGVDRGEVIRRFAPYYNDSSSGQLTKEKLKETRILISTDVLSEGLNLQDATCLINYDLHWNPVRLMQRIGRVDRRMDPSVEKELLKDHPEQAKNRGIIHFWNFLPPDDLERLLSLYKRVSHKTLRISKVFGIEGKKLLTPEDDFAALRDINHDYEGEESELETMHLEYQQLLKDYPGLEEKLSAFPMRVFSGKENKKRGSKSLFFCYTLPAPAAKDKNHSAETPDIWTEDAGYTKWYLYDINTKKIHEDPAQIIEVIRSTPDAVRRHHIDDKTLADIRIAMDKHIKNSYLKQVQAPIGVKPVLKAWLELN